MIIRIRRPIAFRSVRHGFLCGAIVLSPALAWGDPPAELTAFVATPLHASVEKSLNWELPIDLTPLASAPEPVADPSLVDLRIIPRGNEMSALASVELDRTERHFRAEVVDWFAARSVAAGVVSDVIVRGSDRGLHLHVRGGGQYMLLWETRF